MDNYMKTFYDNLTSSVNSEFSRYRLNSDGINCINIDVKCKSNTYLLFDEKN